MTRVQTGILRRRNQTFSDGSDIAVQGYFDRVRRFDQALDVLSMADADLQYHFPAGGRNDIVAGLGYRLTGQSLVNGYQVSIRTADRRDNLFSGFVQDELALTESLALTAGIKLEHISYTGFENEPSLQLAWSSGTRHIWASASKAIQQPGWFYVEGQHCGTESAHAASYQIVGRTNRASFTGGTRYCREDHVAFLMPPRLQIGSGE